MKIIIAGIGRIGYSIAAELSKEKHDLTAIEIDPKIVEEISDTLDVITIVGNAVNYDILKTAGVEKADLLIAVTNADETNLLICLTAKKLGVKRTIARVRNMEFYRQATFLGEELGLSLLINPEESTANEISHMLRFPAASKVEPFAHGRAESVELPIMEDSPLNGLTLNRFHDKITEKILVCAVARGNEVFIPKGDFTLRTGDKVNIIGAYKEINRFLDKVFGKKRTIKNVMILGGGKTAYYLANQIVNAGINLKVIERDKNICSEMKLALPKVCFTLGDGTRYDVLNEEGLASADAFVALTGDDEVNAITSMYAESLGVKKVVAKINESHIVKMLANRQVVNIVRTSSVATQRIVSYVRSMQNAYDSSVEALYFIFDGRVETLEFRLSGVFPYYGIPLKRLRFGYDTLISSIIRKGKCIIPGGEESILPGDNVIVTTSRSGVESLEELMERI